MKVIPGLTPEASAFLTLVVEQAELPYRFRCFSCGERLGTLVSFVIRPLVRDDAIDYLVVGLMCQDCKQAEIEKSQPT